MKSLKPFHTLHFYENKIWTHLVSEELLSKEMIEAFRSAHKVVDYQYPSAQMVVHLVEKGFYFDADLVDIEETEENIFLVDPMLLADVDVSTACLLTNNLYIKLCAVFTQAGEDKYFEDVIADTARHEGMLCVIKVIEGESDDPT